MSNLTDALIAAKLVGGSGGSGGGSGLPEITTETTVILEEQTLTFEDRGGVYGATVAGTFDIAVGDTFTVSYDGDDYEVTVFEVADRGILGFGNLSLTEPGADTGEPFFGGIMEGNGLVIIASTSDPTHEVGISSTIYNPANGSILVVDGGEWKTVQSGGIGLISTKPVTVVESQTVPFEQEGEGVGFFIGDLQFISPLLVGANYSVNWDGVVYTCTPYILGEAIVIEAPGREPFRIEYLNDIMTAYTNSTLASHVIEITGAIQTPSDGSALIVKNGEWTTNPMEVLKTVNCECATSVTIQAGAIADVLVKEIPTLHHTYAAIRIVKIAEGAIPLIVLSGAFSGNMATFKVYNPTTESVYFGRNSDLSVTGIMM